MVYLWLPLMFALGAIIGSFLNVCIARLPLEKSILWPIGSRCGHCGQPILWQDNIPLLSYLILRGRCRTCGQRFSSSYFFVELLTGLGFAGLFYLIVLTNVHQLPPALMTGVPFGVVPRNLWIIFAHHAVLFSFLVVIACCDLSRREIPISVSLCGAVVGLAWSALFPWPWPHPAPAAVVAPRLALPWWLPPPLPPPPQGALQPWPLWWPLPDWLPAAGTWQLGLLNGLAGMLAGTWFLRAIRFLFSMGLGKEALGLGDADLMMMAGCFLGWQPVVTAFFIAVFPALLFGLLQLVFMGDRALAFGPALAFGVLLTCLFWSAIGPSVAPLAFNGPLLLMVGVVGGGFLLVSSVVLRLLRWGRGG